MENMWLMANSLGIGFHVVSAISAPPVAKEVMKLLNIPKTLQVAYSARLGYATNPVKYLRVRRDINDFSHLNSFGSKGLE
jgi:nitroreductase